MPSLIMLFPCGLFDDTGHGLPRRHDVRRRRAERRNADAAMRERYRLASRSPAAGCWTTRHAMRRQAPLFDTPSRRFLFQLETGRVSSSAIYEVAAPLPAPSCHEISSSTKRRCRACPGAPCAQPPPNATFAQRKRRAHGDIARLQG